MDEPPTTVDRPSTSTPFGRGSMSLRLYPHALASPTAVLDELEHQAALAEARGFDGVLLSERHGGAWGQIPNPLQVAGFLLGATSTLWAAPCPLLLPFRRAAVVAEELAWLHARHPGRIGAGFGSGGNAPDFALVGVPFAERSVRFDRELRRVVALLRGDVRGVDPAVAAAHDVPLVSASMSRTAARRAAELGIGIIGSSLLDEAAIASNLDDHRAHGGTGPHVVIARVWLGAPPRSLMERALAHYREASRDARGAGGASVADTLLAADDPVALADAIVAHAHSTRADAMNLRVHVAGLDVGAARAQIADIADEVLPLVRTAWRP